jgi:subtilisin family serine protease
VLRRGRGERLGRLASFEIVEMPKATVARTRDRLARASAAGRPRPVYHTSADRVPFVPEGTLFLRFREGASKVDAVLRRHDLAVDRVSGGFLTVRAQNADMVEVAAALQQEPAVDVAEPDLVTPRLLLDFLPNDLQLAHQWHLENRGEIDGNAAGLTKGADARVVAAWRRLGHLGLDKAVVAVIDDGVDLTHPDLVGKARDPFDFIRGNDDVSPQPDLRAALAGDWHGTACAGVAVGKAQGGEIVGAAPNALLMPVRMNDHLSPEQVERWFDYVTEKGAWVVSCSWGAEAAVYELPLRIARAIHRCATEGRGGKGCVVVFAAGNNGKDVNDLPRSLNGLATHPDVLAVAASTSLDKRANYSAKGREIAVCAPSKGLGGLGITTADVTGTYVDDRGVERGRGYHVGSYYSDFSGTSSACPLVAGVCSLVLSANPELTAADVRTIIRRTARQIGKPSDYVDGHSTKFGHGCVNAEAAVDLALRTATDGATLLALRTDGHPIG